MNRSIELFMCRRCGACCRVPGVVRVTDEDIDRLAAFLEVSPEDFIAQFTRLSPSRTGLVLNSGLEEPCMFLSEDNSCRVHPARPQQCRDYPERWWSEEIAAVCQALKGGQ